MLTLRARDTCTDIAHYYLGGVYMGVTATAANEPRAVALTCGIIWRSNLAAKSHQVSLIIFMSPASDVPAPSHSRRSLSIHRSMRQCERVGPGPLNTCRTRRRQRAVTALVCPGSTLATADLPLVCPWRLEIVRTVLLGTHDAQSPSRNN